MQNRRFWSMHSQRLICIFPSYRWHMTTPFLVLCLIFRTDQNEKGAPVYTNSKDNDLPVHLQSCSESSYWYIFLRIHQDYWRKERILWSDWSLCYLPMPKAIVIPAVAYLDMVRWCYRMLSLSGVRKSKCLSTASVVLICLRKDKILSIGTRKSARRIFVTLIT